MFSTPNGRASNRTVPQSTHSRAVRAPQRSPVVHRQGRRLRGRGQTDQKLPFAPPETWHEPHENSQGYRVVVQHPGTGYRHIVTADDVRERLAQLPTQFTERLQVVQLSRMTRKKRSWPLYGMQWGTALYLYPIEIDLMETYDSPPNPQQLNEARMYGGRWEQSAARQWRLVWTEEALRDFYLNNILIHELGHLVDDRNDRTVDRERFAEWFAVEYGYKPTMSVRRPVPGPVVRRHAKR